MTQPTTPSLFQTQAKLVQAILVGPGPAVPERLRPAAEDEADENLVLDVTGLLIAVGGRVVRLLEGRPEAVAARCEATAGRPVHVAPADRRLYGSWGMACVAELELPPRSRATLSRLLGSLDAAGDAEAALYGEALLRVAADLRPMVNAADQGRRVA